MALAAGCGGEGNVFELAEGDCFNYDESDAEFLMSTSCRAMIRQREFVTSVSH